MTGPTASSTPTPQVANSAGLEIQVREETPERITLVLPPALPANDELSAQELDGMVAACSISLPELGLGTGPVDTHHLCSR